MKLIQYPRRSFGPPMLGIALCLLLCYPLSEPVMETLSLFGCGPGDDQMRVLYAPLNATCRSIPVLETVRQYYDELWDRFVIPGTFWG